MPTPDLTSFHTRWDLLRTIQQLFLTSENLPSVQHVGKEQYGNLSDDEVHEMQNNITMLRNDLKMNIIMQQLVSFDQLVEESTIESVELVVGLLLERFEDSVDWKDERLQNERKGRTPHYGFPGLFAIRNLLQRPRGPETKHFPGSSRHEPVSRNVRSVPQSIKTEENFKMQELLWGAGYSPESVALVSSHIRFPKQPGEIWGLTILVSKFHGVLKKLLGKSPGQSRREQDYGTEDKEAIQHAYDFAATCTSLFSQVVNSIQCGVSHQARINLSGFKQNQLRIGISSCQTTDWVPVLFTRASEKPSTESFCCSNMCSPTSSRLDGRDTLHITFNSDGMWEYLNDCVGVDSARSLVKDHYAALEDFLNHRDQLKPMHRKLVAVLLAASLCQLSNSPWIAQQLGTDTVFVPSPQGNTPLHQWYPRVGCTLIRQEHARLSSDDIAAFGVLVLELEANRKADWTIEDVDIDTGMKSNQVRLVRILGAWDDLICDDYRNIGWACAEFDKLVERFDHPDIETDRKGLAIFYKFIYLPLRRHSSSAFGRLDCLFEGFFRSNLNFAARTRIPATAPVEQFFFDDGDISPKSEDSESARKFIENLGPLFKRIADFHDDSSKANNSKSEKIRIVVLDSGIDRMDPKIRAAILDDRINSIQSKSFIGPSDDLQDTHGHGTHVTKLLLNTAQAAEIYIGKVFAEKTINDELMSGITEAIDWAVRDCKAHVISMSFGFDGENKLIEEALDKATGAGKLLFAAASNNGGISGRARPARHQGVICIHASDGNGNKGGMNPSPCTSEHNFSTLGVAVPSKWKKKEVWKTGTSFATPIAAGFAANVLQFALDECNGVTENSKKKLFRKKGMEAIFREMTEVRDGYDFVHPGRFWTNWQEDPERGDETELEIGKRINRIMDKL